MNAITLNYENTASFDVDPQKSFTPLCPNELPVAEGHLIADPLNEQASLASIRVGSKDAHTPTAIWVATEENPQFTPVKNGGPNVDIHWKPHCIPGTPGFEFLDGLPRDMEYDFMVYKGVAPDLHPYGACYHDLGNTRTTGVIEFLRSRNIDTVLVGGLATDFCVKNTALQLADAGFNVIVNLKACRGISPEGVQTAIAEMEKAGAVVVDNLDNYLVKSENKNKIGL